jgi:hypothetical protein
MVLEPSIKAAVTAGVDWVRELVITTSATERNTLALERNTTAQGSSNAGGAADGMTSGTMLGYAAMAVIAYGFARSLFGVGTGGAGASGRPTFEGTFSRGGNFRGGMRQGFEEDLGILGGGKYYSTQFSAFTREQTAAVNKHITDLQKTFDALGTAVGDLSIKNRQWSITLSGVDDLSAAITSSMGNTLIPALEQFRLVGEDLAKTAERLTAVFTTTSTFIVALGVSSKDAFGALGIASANARQALIDATGGVDAFNQKAGSFIQNFLTDVQKLQPALDAVGRTFAELGITGVSTNKQFADLVAQELKLGHYDVVNRLLSVGDAFNQITTAAKATQDQLLSMLKTSSFETLVSYQRARGQARGAGSAAADIAAATETAAQTQIPAEQAANESAARKALKEKVWAIYNTPPVFMGMRPGTEGWRESLTAIGMTPVSPFDVINTGGDLGAWYARLRGIYDTLPAFAAGGDHTGGLRLVGENGPEIEATGPARIYNASQTRAMLAGSDGNAELAAEIRGLRADLRASQGAIALAAEKSRKILDKFDKQGLPAERVV